MEYQKTVGEIICIEGEGVFTGKNIKVIIEPARENTGIIFFREDLPSKPAIPLSIENIIGLEGATALTNGKEIIYLVEHLLSALHGLQIDNAIIKVYGEEIPLLDGSSYIWVRKIREVGYKYFFAPKKKYKILKEYEFYNGSGKIKFKPSDTLKISAEIDFKHPLIGHQKLSTEITPYTYIEEICFARTFGFLDELREKKRKRILKGGDFSNAIILDKEKVLNPEGLRTSDEFVRHKVLDIIGDIYGGGMPLIGEIHAVSSGHKLHIEALKNLFRKGLIKEIESGSLTFLIIPKKKQQKI